MADLAVHHVKIVGKIFIIEAWRVLANDIGHRVHFTITLPDALDRV